VITVKDNYELKNPRSNPYAERMKNGYTIIIERGNDSDEQIDEQSVHPVEVRAEKLTNTSPEATV
jgi:hypothetical protein